jgi:adenylate cyclase
MNAISSPAHQDLLMHLSEHEAHPDPVDSPTDEAAASRWGSGVEAPGEFPAGGGQRTVVRTFAFLDLCGSTSFLEREGAQATSEVVSHFRAQARQVTAQRGLRVAKWMGDGAMLVGVATGPVVASAVELCARMDGSPLRLRGGVAVSMALIFDGDDYLGRGANFAARICDAAAPGEVLCDPDCFTAIPEWVAVVGSRGVSVRGMGHHDVLRLARVPEAELAERRRRRPPQGR